MYGIYRFGSLFELSIIFFSCSNKNSLTQLGNGYCYICIYERIFRYVCFGKNYEIGTTKYKINRQISSCYTEIVHKTLKIQMSENVGINLNIKFKCDKHIIIVLLVSSSKDRCSRGMQIRAEKTLYLLKIHMFDCVF